MSLLALSTVFECYELTSSEKLVSLYISDKVNDVHHWEFYGSLDRLIKETSLKRDTVYKTMKSLVKKGFLSCIGKRGRTKIYRFNIDRYKVEQIDYKIISPEKGTNISPEKGTNISPEKGTLTKEPTQELTKEKIYKKEIDNDWNYHKPLYDETNLKLSDLPAIKSSNTNLMIETCISENPFNIPESLLNDFKEVRRIKRQPITLTAWQDTTKELQLCVDKGLDPVECFTKFVSAGWARLNHKYFIENKTNELDNNDTSWGDEDFWGNKL